MKKIILILFLLMTIYNSSYSQFSTAYEAWRVVYVSPNYTNVYPRYSTLQQVWNATKDSASASTGKYFIINVVTNFNNISDWSSGYKDSILNRSPYMTLIQFGLGVQDTITGVDANQFNLVSGIISLKTSLAGDGISFSSNAFHINPTNYLGTALYLDGDSLKLRLNNSLYFTPNVLSLKRPVFSGLQLLDSGIRVLPRAPLALSSDTTFLKYKLPLTTNSDSLTLDYETNHFTLDGGNFAIKLDSGITSSSSGLKTWLDNQRIVYNTSKRITLPDALAGDGIIWNSNALKILLATQTTNGNLIGNILTLDTDSLQFNYNGDYFSRDGNGLIINLDSGLTTATGVQLLIDQNEMSFDASKQLQVASTLAGNGLVKSSDQINILPNEFLSVGSDTLKAKTSYTLQFYGDSLTTNVTSIGILPYDSTGVPVLGTGKVKRITYTFQLSTGNDTIKTTSNSVVVTSGDKIRLVWNNSGSRWVLQRWSIGTRTWSNQINLDATGFANKPYRIIVELYAEAE